MNNFVHAIDGLCTNDVRYTITDILYIGNKHWDKQDKAGLIRKSRLEIQNDYKERRIYMVSF